MRKCCGPILGAMRRLLLRAWPERFNTDYTD
jgi:hypothetical protein